MIPSLTPAELRTAVRLMAIYAEATAHILAEEMAADAAAAPTGADLVSARFGGLTSTPEERAQLAEYLDRLETTHGRDRAMRKFIDRHRAHLTASTTETASPDLLPQVAQATEGDPSHG